MKELKRNQPSCVCYIIITKTDLLEPSAPGLFPAACALGISAKPGSQQQMHTSQNSNLKLHNLGTPAESGRSSSSSRPEDTDNSVLGKDINMHDRASCSPTSPLDWKSSGKFWMNTGNSAKTLWTILPPSRYLPDEHFDLPCCA